MIECEDSAYKHWLTQPQIDYVFRHPVAMFEVSSRNPGDRVMAMLGYPDESEERRVEILVSARTRKVFHAMDCRPEWISRFAEHERGNND
ncbi:hypothetical protein OZX67_00320 [Bifidobacterium sp. ESL0728]|uniref:hypothetical protein n=1 Tax=Bifidobacterium sp. ESL0728 TaxID=2983220 RepID=UPI0023F8E601|nr:hypothetical protein [Bifidobacterium sp. ESL0728]WEV59065.1 hypothetical protein OZX67_00320 [Bifidobacterium sp. ESL0728]